MTNPRDQSQAPVESKPRRRRRWLIALILLFVLSAYCWWNWPRGDPRFVGKWASYYEGFPESSVTLTLRNDGTGRSDYSGTTPSHFEYEWSVFDGNFVIGTQSKPKSFVLRLLEPVFRLGGKRVYTDADVMTIEDVQPDVIQLRRPNHVKRMTLRRLPE
jgi:hypothetical protein